jgi:hypothetical protein
LRAWNKVIAQGVEPREVTAADLYAMDRKLKDPAFTKHAATWLNQRCWEDEPAAPPAPSGPVPTCERHLLPLPCRSCAADAKAADRDVSTDAEPPF